MQTLLKQFVPSKVCLECDGCCRFKDAASAWRPRTGYADRDRLGLRITAESMDDAGYIKTIRACGNHVCRFLKSEDNTCRVYQQRPFECELYPFILSHTGETIQVHVHLSCPYVQLNQPSPELNAYIDYLKEFFSRPATRDLLKRNTGMLHDYSAYALELLHLFDLPAL